MIYIYIYIYTHTLCLFQSKIFTNVKYFHFTMFDCQCENTMKIIFQFHCKIIFFSYFSKLNWCIDLQQKKIGAQTYVVCTNLQQQPPKKKTGAKTCEVSTDLQQRKTGAQTTTTHPPPPKKTPHWKEKQPPKHHRPFKKQPPTNKPPLTTQMATTMIQTLFFWIYQCTDCHVIKKFIHL